MESSILSSVLPDPPCQDEDSVLELPAVEAGSDADAFPYVTKRKV